MVVTLGFLHLEDMNTSSTEPYSASHPQNLAHAAAVSIYRSKYKVHVPPPLPKTLIPKQKIVFVWQLRKKKMSTGGEKGSATTKTPADFLKSIRGRPVVVKLNSGVDYRGILACLDGYMNIAMEQTEEYVNGQLKNKYGDAFIRGNNVLYISTSKRTLADGA
uniref:Sm domain-containing protein n=1 Tax=Populus alba TaxID=43335 RepID=A0A4U5QCB4_POPAL|nr:hypothetical protein D5086_0000110870 [Populus alba]